MILNNRQTAILYELIKTNDFLSYSYLCSRFTVTEKTMRADINKLNDFLNKYDIIIKLNKGKGFKLECSREQRETLKANFDYRYKDSSEIQNTYHKKDLSINYYLSKGPVKEADLSKKLNISISSITKVLNDIRKKMQDYDISVVSKPYSGLMIQGNEINIRNYLIDSTSLLTTEQINNLFLDDPKVFNIDDQLTEVLANALHDAIRKNDIKISQHGMTVIIIAILFSIQRSGEGHDIEFTEEQIELIRSYQHYDSYDRLLDVIEKKIYRSFTENDRYFIVAYGMLLGDYKERTIDNQFLGKTEHYVSELMDLFERYNICDSKDLPVLQKHLSGIVNNALIRAHLGFVEMYYDNSLRSALINSPLSMTIGILLFHKLESLMERRLGDYALLSIVHSVYYQIRDIVRTNKLSNIAVFSPMYFEEGFTVADRIMYHCSQFVDNVDVLTGKDLLTTDLRKYDLLVYFGDYEPFETDISIDKQKISFYFNSRDRNEIYEKLSLMSRFYKNCFGSLNKEDIISNSSEIFDLSSIYNYVRKLCNKDAKLLEQLEMIPLTSLLVFEDTFNIVLFTDKDELKTTKLIKLKKPIRYNDQKILRVMINIISSNSSAINIKTIENVIRNMLEHVTYNIENIDFNEDLLQYYIKDSM